MLPPKKRLLDQVRDRLRLKNFACRTEKSCLYGFSPQKPHPLSVNICANLKPGVLFKLGKVLSCPATSAV